MLLHVNNENRLVDVVALAQFIGLDGERQVVRELYTYVARCGYKYTSRGRKRVPRMAKADQVTPHISGPRTYRFKF